jgi:hypothetical protein
MAEAEEHVYRALVRAGDDEALKRLLADRSLDFGCRPAPRRHPEGGFAVPVYVSEQRLRELEKKGYTVQVLGDATEEAKRVREDFATGDPFEGGRVAPRGLGEKF